MAKLIKSALEKLPAAARTEFKESLELIKAGDYKGTAVKVELEAQLDRPYRSDGTPYCSTCDGDGYCNCNGCDGDGYTEHEPCNGEGCNLDECEDGELTCTQCNGDGHSECAACDGTGRQRASSSPTYNFANVDECKRFILANVPQDAAEALIYSRFYNDGSVDSEFTFTLPIDQAEMAVYFIEAFNLLAKAISPRRKPNTAGAGMHIAILNSSTGNYPSGNGLNGTCATNFANSMTPLLPALYFLASASHKSRGLRYRPPKIDLYDKYAAISGSNRVFEYRIFETCYERPLAFIDYMIVIANTLKFYKFTATKTSFGIGKLGIKDGSGIERFYYTTKHMEALEKGLAILKPKYKTITQLGVERNFVVNNKTVQDEENKRLEQWKADYLEVKKRRHNERLRIYHQGVAKAYELRQRGEEVNIKDYAKKYLSAHTDAAPSLRGDVQAYLKQQSDRFAQADVSYTVQA